MLWVVPIYYLRAHFQALSRATNALGLPYLAVPLQIPSDHFAALAPSGVYSVKAAFPAEHSSYVIYDDTFTFVHTHNAIFNHVLHNMVSPLQEYG
ncbi:hypothetical protein METBIDRAFT_96033 [Metschnikowia bicuspidata var. bicuspidata NRRL YB-4993]|uniref:Uncharacterized protein n=1 Tax=Metschnikowia bicuspidata var. bicuspidata NRRL YB-4993 TaxID=869754 RepID=A0A1A0HFQ1_9ASCO|nr:hypothetical protein METBIDRAFT_96033 [Metschnikowia bicuspidata var. bicuspidata NRRL YB-4993]OBA22984.1 hypothetical protein METBIDRAFT_96033 [Metschnikowia bicuspidata var. bicuspidata NRRL YB-4993]